MMNQALAASVAAALLCAGCSSNILVSNPDGSRAAGVPFRMPEPYVRVGMHNQHKVAGPQCAPAQFVQFVTLPTGAQYFVQVRPGLLANTSFAVKYAPGGNVSEISLGTQPAGAATVDSITSAATSLLPFAGVTPAAPTAAPSSDVPFVAALTAALAEIQGFRNGAEAPPTVPRACDAGETQVRLYRLEDWQRAQAAIGATPQPDR